MSYAARGARPRRREDAVERLDRRLRRVRRRCAWPSAPAGQRATGSPSRRRGIAPSTTFEAIVREDPQRNFLARSALCARVTAPAARGGRHGGRWRSESWRREAPLDLLHRGARLHGVPTATRCSTSSDNQIDRRSTGATRAAAAAARGSPPCRWLLGGAVHGARTVDNCGMGALGETLSISKSTSCDVCDHARARAQQGDHRPRLARRRRRAPWCTTSAARGSTSRTASGCATRSRTTFGDPLPERPRRTVFVEGVAADAAATAEMAGQRARHALRAGRVPSHAGRTDYDEQSGIYLLSPRTTRSATRRRHGDAFYVNHQGGRRRSAGSARRAVGSCILSSPTAP